MAGSSVIGALRVNLGLDSAQFQSGAKKSSSVIDQLRSKFKVNGAAIAAAVTAAGVAVTAFAVKSAADIDKTAKAARRIGESVAGFRAMELAAGESGVEVSSLTDGVQTMNRELAKGGKNSTSALAQLGLDAKAFREQRPAEQLATLADAIQKTGSSSGEVAAILQNLGVRNKEMVLALVSGGDAFRNAAKDIADYGLAMSDVDASSIETANDRIGRLSLAGKYLGDQLAISVVPALGAMALAMTDSLRAGGFLRAVLDGIAVSVRAGVTLVTTFVDVLSGVGSVVSVVTGSLSSFGVSSSLIGEAMKAVAGAAAVTATIFAGRYALAVGVTAAKAMMVAVQQSIALQMALGATSRASATAAAASVLFSRALTVLKGALISTGIGALVVGAGYLIAKFTELSGKVGGFGNAVRLLVDVVRDAWGRMALYASIWGSKAAAVWSDIRASAVEKFGAIISAGGEFGNRYIGVYRGAFDAVVAIWGGLPAAIGDVAYQAANALISAVSWMLTQAARPIDAFIGGLNEVRTALGAEPIQLIGDIKLPELTNPYAKAASDVGKAAAAAFNAGFNTDTISDPGGYFDGVAEGIRGQAAAYREAAGALAKTASGPLASVQAIKDAMDESKGAITETTEATGELGNALDSAGGKGARAGKEIEKSLTDAEKAANRGADSIGSMFSSLLDGSKTLRQGVADLIMEIAKMQIMNGFKSLFGAGGAGSGIGSFLGSLIGANAAGTEHWRGGLTSVHERGGEIMDLPNGTRIIPHDVSKRLVAAGAGSSGSFTYAPNIDARGADAGAVARLEQALQADRAQFEAKVVQAVHKGKVGRRL